MILVSTIIPPRRRTSGANRCPIENRETFALHNEYLDCQWLEDFTTQGCKASPGIALTHSHKYHNTIEISHTESFCNRNMHTCAQFWYILGHKTGVLWSFCNRSINLVILEDFALRYKEFNRLHVDIKCYSGNTDVTQCFEMIIFLYL